MKICFLGSKSYPALMGGIQTHISEIAPRLEKKGFSIYIITAKENGQKSEEIIEGVRIFRLPYLKWHLAVKISMMPEVLSLTKRIDPDIVHAHDATMGFAASTFLSGCPIVYTAHASSWKSNEWRFPINHIIHFFQIMAFSKANTVFCVDKDTFQTVKKYNKSPILIHNGIDIEKFNQKYQIPKQYHPNKIRLLFVGRIVPVKGLHILLKSINSLIKSDLDKIELYIIGTGPILEDLKTLAINIPQIKFIGMIPHDDIVPFYIHSNIFILPSLSEGMPFSLLEAMAARNACICTSVGDISMHFNDRKELIIINPNNHIELAAAIHCLINNTELREELGLNAKAKITKEYQWSDVVDKLEKTYYHLST